MAQVNKKINEVNDKRKDSEDKIISIMVKDKEDVNDEINGLEKRLGKDMLDTYKSAVKHAITACENSQRQAEEKQEAVRTERQAKYAACISNIQDSVIKVEESMKEHNKNIISNLVSISSQINSNSQKIAVQDAEIKNIKKEG